MRRVIRFMVEITISLSDDTRQFVGIASKNNVGNDRPLKRMMVGDNLLSQLNVER